MSTKKGYIFFIHPIDNDQALSSHEVYEDNAAIAWSKCILWAWDCGYSKYDTERIMYRMMGLDGSKVIKKECGHPDYSDYISH